MSSKHFDLSKILEERGEVGKFDGIAPEGFILIHEKTLEDLKDFDIWKDWKNGHRSIKEMNNLNLQDT